MVLVTLHGPGRSVPVIPALIDSGADAALFDVAWAETVFGLRRSEAVRGECAGIGDMPLMSWRWPESSFFIEFAGEVIPLIDLEFVEMSGPPILGRHDFFARFAISIDEGNQRVFISPDRAVPWPPRE